MNAIEARYRHCSEPVGSSVVNIIGPENTIWSYHTKLSFFVQSLRLSCSYNCRNYLQHVIVQILLMELTYYRIKYPCGVLQTIFKKLCTTLPHACHSCTLTIFVIKYLLQLKMSTHILILSIYTVMITLVRKI